MIKTAIQNQRPQRHPHFFRKPLALAVSLLFLGTTPAVAHADPGVTDLDMNSLYFLSSAYGVNAAGDVAVGYFMTSLMGGISHAFRWTQATGMIDLGTLSTGNAGRSVAYGVSAAGDVVVGWSDINAGGRHAFRWTQATGMIDLGTMAANKTDGSSTAWGVNADGNVVVGEAQLGVYSSRAFRWTLNSGSATQGTMTDLGTLRTTNDNLFSVAYGVNKAGDVVVGKSNTDSGYDHAFRWTLNTGSATQGTMTDLGTLKSGNAGESFAQGVNAAGDVVVGQSQTDSGNTHAVRWTFNDGSAAPATKTDLGTLKSGNAGNSYAWGVNAAGDVVVGSAIADSGDRAFRWTAATGMQSIEDWLTANGVTVNPSAPKTSSAYGVNAAGDVVVGRLINSHAFIATTKSSTTKGLLDLVENHKSLAGSSGTPARAMQDASLVMHGAHSSPMRGLLTAGKQSLWVAGDWGRSDNQGNDGHLGAGEVGYARGINDQVMVKFALGRTYSRQDTLFGGNTKVDGTYIMPELIAKLSGTPLYATVSGYYNWSETDVTRGYDNAGNREYGRGSADLSTAALRARLDWLDALKAGNTSVTPYTSVTYIRTKVDAYRETGGAFPANWNSRTEDSTEARLGLDVVHHLDDKLDLLGRLEGVHRFNDTGATASGDVAGLYGFSLPGQHYKRDWLRAAVGVEGRIGGGMGSLMLNGSTQGNATEYWLAASYRMDF
ncbi:MAG: hypothetical protein BGO63_02550 [Candidatus Accumulibacter sp. 66-26]|nr:autotransporter domain-containing protein [Accumulibacter sp.]OJW48028.1 MAG: hypothetical protein BGO63_02550 [Candidatus Accumulibacter sp. 66-26]